MARRSARPKETDDDSGLIAEKDFAKAVRIFREDILPAQAKVGEFAQEQSTAYKALKKQCGIQPQAARTAFRLSDMEEAKRDDWMRCFIGLCREMGIPLESNDLVDQAEAAPRPKPVLATLPISDGTETDLTDAADTEARDLDLTGANPFEEATPDELAKQAGRGKATKGKDKPDLKAVN